MKAKNNLISTKAILLMIVLINFICLNTFSAASVSKSTTNNTLYVYKPETKYGFTDSNGKFIIPPVYSKAELCSDENGVYNDNYYIVTKDNLQGCISFDPKFTLPCKYERLDNYSEGLIAFEEKGKWGFIDAKDGFARVQSSDGKWGVIDTKGNIVEKPNYTMEFMPIVTDCLEKIQVDNKIGFADAETGKTVISPQFDGPIDSFTCNYKFINGKCAVKIDGKYGIIDKSGNYLVKPDYQSITVYNDGNALLCNQDKQFIINLETLKQYETPKLSQSRVMRQAEQFPIAVSLDTSKDDKDYSNSKYCFLDQQGKVVIKPAFDDACDFSDGLAAVYENDKWGFIDNTGKIVIKPKFDEPAYFEDGFAIVSYNNGHGVIDKKGNFIVQPKYYQIDKTDDDLFRLRDDSNGNTKITYVDNKGKSVVPDGFELYSSSSDAKIMCVKTITKYGFINNNGKIIIPTKYDNAEDFSCGRAKVIINDKVGYIDQKGKYVVTPKFSDGHSFSDGLALVEENGYWGYIDVNGKFKIYPQYFNDTGCNSYYGTEDFDHGLTPYYNGDMDCPEKYIDKNGSDATLNDFCKTYSEDLALIIKNGKIGYVDKKGKVVIKPQFDLSLNTKNSFYPIYSDFHGGLAAIATKNGWGFINKKGAFVIKPQYEQVQSFSENLAAVKIDGKWGFINTKGKITIKPSFKSVSGFSEGLAAVCADTSRGERFGYINKNGKYVINNKYVNAGSFSNGIAKVRDEQNEIDDFYYIDKKGNKLIINK